MATIKLRRDTAANWTIVNSVLSQGEVGVELSETTSIPSKFKIGNGATAWNSLPYGVPKASSAETIAGTSSDLFTTPEGVAAAILQAELGTIGIADSAATIAGTSTTLATTPAGVRAAIQSLASRAMPRFDSQRDMLRAGMARSINQYYDADQFVEEWASLSAWAVSTGQVSGGHLYPSNTGGEATAGANRLFIVGAGQILRIQASVHLKAGAGGATLVGFSALNAGAAPGPGLTGFSAIGSLGANLGMVTNGTVVVGPGCSTGDYLVTITVDVDNDKVIMQLFDTVTFTARMGLEASLSACGGAINNIAVYVNDTAGLSSSYIGKLAAKKAAASIFPRADIEDIQPWDLIGVSNTQTYRCIMPKSYDSRIGVPLCIYFHGTGENHDSFLGDANEKTVVDELLNRGYAIVSSDFHGDNWGNQDALNDLQSLILDLSNRISITSIVAIGQSMGAVASLNAIHKLLYPISAWVGIYPVCSLADQYAFVAGHTTQINTAYGIPGSGTYAAQTAGFDPLLAEADKFSGVPMLFFASEGDTLVRKAQNTDALVSHLASYAQTQVVVHTGDHGDASAFQPTAVADFFDISLGR